MATSKDRKVNVAEFSKHFSDQVEDADSLYAESLQRLKKLRGARKGHQKRELKRQARKLGGSNPRTLRYAERIAREKEMEKYIDVAIDKTTINTDSIKDTYILRGKVRADNIKGIASYKVQLQDARNNVIGVPVKTDSKGNYSIVVDIEEGVKHEGLNIAVLDQQDTEIHRDKLPVLLKTGAVDTRDILIANIDKVDRSKEGVIEKILKSKERLGPKTKKVVSKKATTKKSAAKKAPSKKATSKKSVAKKAPSKKATSKKSVAKKAPSKKATSKKTVAKKTPSKKAVSKKPTRKKVAKKVQRKKMVRKKTT